MHSGYHPSLGECKGYDAMGSVVGLTCAKPEMWLKTLFEYQRLYDPRTNSTRVQTTGTLGVEECYEMPFNEKNLKELFSLRESDNDIAFIVKDEASGKAVSVRKESNLNKPLELFQKPFGFLHKSWKGLPLSFVKIIINAINPVS
jgi:hypothetical protein